MKTLLLFKHLNTNQGMKSRRERSELTQGQEKLQTGLLRLTAVSLPGEKRRRLLLRRTSPRLGIPTELLRLLRSALGC